MKNLLTWKNGVVAILILWLINLMTKKTTNSTKKIPEIIEFPSVGVQEPQNIFPENPIIENAEIQNPQYVDVPQITIPTYEDDAFLNSGYEVLDELPNIGYIKPDYHHINDSLKYPNIIY